MEIVLTITISPGFIDSSSGVSAWNAYKALYFLKSTPAGLITGDLPSTPVSLAALGFAANAGGFSAFGLGAVDALVVDAPIVDVDGRMELVDSWVDLGAGVGLGAALDLEEVVEPKSNSALEKSGKELINLMK